MIIYLQVEKRLSRASLRLLSVWLFSWTPYALVFLANISGYSSLVTHHADMLPGIGFGEKIKSKYFFFYFKQFLPNYPVLLTPWFMDSCKFSNNILLCFNYSNRLPSFKKYLLRLLNIRKRKFHSPQKHITFTFKILKISRNF